MSEDVREEIENVNREFADLWNAGDFDGVAAMYTDDAVMLPQGSPPIEGRQAIRDTHARISRLGVGRQEFETLMLDDHGDTVIEVGIYRCYGDSNLVEEGNTMLVWKRQPDGSWKLHWDNFHSTRSRWSWWRSEQG